MSHSKASTVAQSFIGRGIDLFIYKYGDHPRQGRVVNVTSDNIEVAPINQFDFTKNTGQNYGEFINDLALSVGLKGNYGGFSGSIDARYSSSVTQSSDIKFMRMSSKWIDSEVSIGEDLTTLKNNRTQEFLNALEQSTPQQLFQAFGTHVLVKATFGGKAELIVHESQTERLSTEDFELAAQAKYETLGAAVEGSLGITAKIQSDVKKLSGDTRLSVSGGKASNSVKLRENESGAWEEWAQSVEEHPIFLGFPRQSLVPIWDFADDEEKRSELELAYKKLLAENLVTQVFAISSKGSSRRPTAQVTIPENYKLVSGGGKIDWSGVGCLLTESYPLSNNTWKVSGKDHSHAANAKATAYALAIFDPEDIWEIDIKSQLSDKAQHPKGTVEVERGFILTGGGAKVNWTGAGNLLTASYPQSKTTWEARAKDHSYASPATINVYAIGMRSTLQGIDINTDLIENESALLQHPTETIKANGGFTITGGGAKANWTGAGNLLTASYPQSKTTWEGRAKDHMHKSPATLSVYSLGVKVSST